MYARPSTRIRPPTDESLQGIYGVTVDGGEKQYFSGYSATESLQQILFATTNLQEADHNMVVTNENARNIRQYPSYTYLDIDFVSFTGKACVRWRAYGLWDRH